MSLLPAQVVTQYYMFPVPPPLPPHTTLLFPPSTYKNSSNNIMPLSLTNNYMLVTFKALFNLAFRWILWFVYN